MRVRTLLTAAGYRTGIPNGTFGRRLFEAIAQFQGECGFRPTGWLDGAQRARLRALATQKLALRGLRTVARPLHPAAIRAPMGFGLTAERTPRGLDLEHPTRRLSLADNDLPGATAADSYAYPVETFQREGATLHCKVLRPDLVAISASRDGTDLSMRYHQDGPGHARHRPAPGDADDRPRRPRQGDERLRHVPEVICRKSSAGEHGPTYWCIIARAAWITVAPPIGARNHSSTLTTMIQISTRSWRPVSLGRGGRGGGSQGGRHPPSTNIGASAPAVTPPDFCLAEARRPGRRCQCGVLCPTA